MTVFFFFEIRKFLIIYIEHNWHELKNKRELERKEEKKEVINGVYI